LKVYLKGKTLEMLHMITVSRSFLGTVFILYKEAERETLGHLVIG